MKILKKWIDTPLGDESKRFELRELKEALRNKSGNLFSKIEKHADRAETVLSEKIATVSERLRPLKDKGQMWFSAQKWEQLSQGGLAVPYDEIVDSLWIMPSLICCGWSCSIQRTALWSCCCRSRCLMSMPNLLLQG